ESRSSWEEKGARLPTRAGAPQSYTLLQPHGSLEGHVRPNADHARRGAVVQLLGMIGQMQAQHPKSHVRPDHPTEIGEGGPAWLGVPTARNGNVGLDAQAWRRNVHTEARAGDDVRHFRDAVRCGVDRARRARAQL